ncbi:MAG: hypothetical protein RBS43_00480 [Candidatus Cloacimonas sp.]|jgi:hypothetical protein|nr:hypothetical protein [Candidatus Cloacimonas sp.]
MRRSKIFLTVVLILMLVNAVFFAAWYGFGLRNKLREYIAMQAGKAMHGELSIKELRFSDRQVFAEGVTFASADSSLAFKVERLRVQYNLLRFIFSGFKLQRLVREIDIRNPVVRYSYRYKPKPPKAKRPFVLPDLSKLFHSIRVHDGAAIIEATFPLKIVSKGNFRIYEEFSAINITALNRGGTNVKLSAKSKRNGVLTASGEIVKGRIAKGNAALEAFRPLYINHPDITDLQTELSVIASISQDSLGAPFKYNAKTQFWGTEAIFAHKYPLRIPFLGAETDGHNLTAQISRSTIGTSHVSADVKISQLGPKLRFDFAKAEAGLDLTMINPALQGIVNVNLDGKGTIKEPGAKLEVRSEQISYNAYSLQNVALSADYNDGKLQFTMPGSRFDNQQINLKGDFTLATMAANAQLSTAPINFEAQPYLATAEIDVHAELLDKYPLVQMTIANLGFSSKELNISGVHGSINMVPIGTQNYFVDANLHGDNGYAINVVGDILDRNLVIDAMFTKLDPSLIYFQPDLAKQRPLLSGQLKAILQGDKIYTQLALDVQLRGTLPYTTHLEGVGSIDLKSLEASLNLDSSKGSLNDTPLDFKLAANYKDKQLKLYGFQLNDVLSLSGRMNLTNWRDTDFSLALQNISSQDIIQYYPPLDMRIPDFSGLTVFADYSPKSPKNINARISLASVDLLAVTPLSLKLNLNGSLQEIAIDGEINSLSDKLISFLGTGSLEPQINLDMDATFTQFNLEEVLVSSPVLGSLQGTAGITWRNISSAQTDMDLRANVQAMKIKIEDFVIDKAHVKATQVYNKLTVDTLYVFADQLFEVTGHGAIDYNAISKEFYEGTDHLDINVDGQLFTWLKNLTPYILESRGNSSLNCNISTSDDQFLLSGGGIEINDGFLRLKDQSEDITNINIKGIFDKNRIIIERGQLSMGEGKLEFNNIFEADNSEHFMLGFLDMGIFRVMIEEPGIRANIPMFTSPRTLSQVILKGRDSRFATIKGPFDQMKISAEAVIKSANVLYPPDTANLLKLANTVRQATAKHEDTTMAPLPFTLDVMITLGNNVSYVTYPTRLFLMQGGFLHLLYDGQDFKVEEAAFSSERGTIDIFGTVFQVDKVDISMIDAQDLLSVSGTFYKRAPDGTMVTLGVSTSSDLSKSFADRLEFNLTSDNPEDRSISQILARLRYTGVTDPSTDKQSGLLQDEALTLISGNLDSSLLTPFLSPAENFVRKTLKLDNFSVSAGFIQNLYTQYSNDPNQLADNMDLQHFTTDVAQFSSSILLNNLSVSMSKYLGRRFFLDYDLKLQEATDLQKKTRLLTSHEISLRIMLPKRYRLGYTFKYEPQEDQLSHEIMLQRTFRF